MFPATAGYDMASGLGSPQLTSPAGGDGLAYYMCSYGTALTVPSIISLEPNELSTSSGGNVTVQGSNFEIGGVPDVNGVWVNNYLVPPSDVVVTSASSIVLHDLPSGTALVPTDPANDGAGRAIVTVTLGDGASSPVTPASILSVVDTTTSGLSSVVPAVTEVSPFGGSEAGGNQVTIFGSGFESGVTAVTFGGVAATSFHVVSAYEIAATVPAFSGTQTACATALSASSDICQTQVVVTNANGPSESYPIKPTYEGAIVLNAAAALVPPPGCDCEVTPAPSEYDYLPTPRITGVSTSAGPSDYASEEGTSTVTITGVGLSDVGLNLIAFGPVGTYGSVDTSISYASGTEIQVTAPPIEGTVNPVRIPVTIETLAGTSNTLDAAYSGIPTVSLVAPHAASDAGGTAVSVAGNGFSDATRIDIVGRPPSLSDATVYALRIVSNLRTTFRSPAQSPAVADVQVCTTTGCSTTTPSDEMTVYEPGNPVVRSASPRSGPSTGGTIVTISGSNLGCTVAVRFGNRRATTFHNAPAELLDCGSTELVIAQAPAGRPGTRVAITLVTAESAATGYGRSKAVEAATFTYAKARAR